MDHRDHHVILAFRLPSALLLHAAPGIWPRSPRGCTVEVAADGSITVTSFDRHESYATEQVQRVAIAFLRATVRDAPPTAIAAALSAPSTRARWLGYAITLGAKVSIAQTAVKPVIDDALGPLQRFRPGAARAIP